MKPYLTQVIHVWIRFVLRFSQQTNARGIPFSPKVVEVPRVEVISHSCNRTTRPKGFWSFQSLSRWPAIRMVSDGSTRVCAPFISSLSIVPSYPRKSENAIGLDFQDSIIKVCGCSWVPSCVGLGQSFSLKILS